MNVDTLTDTNDNTQQQELNFSDLTDAISKGDSDALDRYMKGEISTNEADEEATSDEEGADKGDTPQEVVEVGDQDEAATSAASTDTATQEQPDELAQLRNEIHRLRSDAGRVPYLQRRVQEMDRELRATKARATTVSDQDTVLPDKVKQRIAALKEIDPDLAETLEAMHSSLAQQAVGAKKAVEELTQHDQEQAEYQFFVEQKSELLKQVPNADAIFATPEWKQWKENLTPGRRALTESGHASEMVQAIYAFAADMQQLHGGTASQSTANSGGGDPANTSATTQQPASALQESRTRKVQVAAEVKNPAAKASVAFDEEAAFKEMYDKAIKNMGLK